MTGKKIKKWIALLLAVFFLPFAAPAGAEGENFEGLKRYAEHFRQEVRRCVLLAWYESREAQPGFPKVIDRWDDPEAWPNFRFAADADLLEIWIPKIHDMDAAILQYQGHTWMLDCCDEKKAPERLVPLLHALGIQEVERLLNSHPHHDHLNGFPAVADAVQVDELLICFPEDVNEHMISAVDYAKLHGIDVVLYGDDSCFPMGDGAVTLVNWQKSDPALGMNDCSAQTMVRYGDCSMLFTADMERAGQLQLLEALGPEALKADILKYPHHGKMHLRDDFFRAVDPSLFVITGIKGAKTCKSSWEYMMRTRTPGVFTQTAVLHLVTDGMNWVYEKAKLPGLE